MDVCLAYLGHLAVRVWHDQDTFDIQHVASQNQCAQHVRGHTCASVSEDFGVAGSHANYRERIDA